MESCMRFFSLLAALLTFALSLLFFSRLVIIEELLASRLEKIGGRAVQVTVSKLNSSELNVSSLAVTFPEDFPVQHVKLKNLTLSFLVKDLLKGELAELTVDVLQVGLRKQQKTPESTLSYQSIARQLDQIQLPPFLPHTFFIKDLTLSGTGAGPLTGQSLQVKTRLLDSGLHGTLLFSDNRLKVEAVLNHFETGTPHLQIHAHHADERLFHLSLQQKNGKTSGKLSSRLATFNSLSSLLPFSIPVLSGEIELKLTASNTAEAPLLDIELDVKGQNLSLPGWNVRSLAGNISLQTDTFETMTFRQGSYMAIGQIQSPGLQIESTHYQFSGNLRQKPGEFSLLSDLDSRLEIKGICRDALQVKQMVIVPALSVTRTVQETRLSLHPEFLATMEGLRQNKVFISTLSISPETPIHVFSPTGSPQYFASEPGKLTIKLNEIHVQDLKIQPAPLSLTIQTLDTRPPTSQFLGVLHSNELSLMWKDATIPLQDIRLSLAKHNNRLEMSLGLSHAIIPGKIEGSVTHDLNTGTGRAQFATAHPFDLRAEQTGLNQLIRGMQIPFSLSSGLIDFTATSHWEQNSLLSVQSHFELREGIGEYKKMLAKDFTIRQELQLFPQLQTLAPGYIVINELTNGITIEKIVLTNQLSSPRAGSLPTLLIDSIEGQVLGGLITSKDITFDPVHPATDFSVQLTGVALAEVVKLIKMKGLSVTGVIDGSLPVQIRNRQIHVPDGELTSRAPGGIINYLPPGGGATVSYLPDYVVQALEEFHYDTLSAIPHYKPDGTLTLAFHIKGVSPRLKTNRPVHLNLNSEQNLLSLLQSLRYSKKLTDDLEKQIQTPHSKKQ